MAATSNHPRLSSERAHEALSEWFSKTNAAAVVFRESTSPLNDSQDDYVVSYEAVFEPAELDQARIEVWITTDCRVAVGLETRERIAARLGTKNRRRGFAAGYEPRPTSEQYLLALLETVAKGQIAISANVVPWLGLGATSAVVTSEWLGTLTSGDDGPRNWFHVVKDLKSSGIKHVLRFRPWWPPQ